VVVFGPGAVASGTASGPGPRATPTPVVVLAPVLPPPPLAPLAPPPPPPPLLPPTIAPPLSELLALPPWWPTPGPAVSDEPAPSATAPSGDDAVAPEE